MALSKALMLVNQAIAINVNEEEKEASSKLNNIYDQLKLELTGIPKKDLDYMSKQINDARIVSVTNYSRGSIIAKEELSKIQVYSKVINIISEAYVHCSRDKGM